VSPAGLIRQALEPRSSEPKETVTCDQSVKKSRPIAPEIRSRDGGRVFPEWKRGLTRSSSWIRFFRGYSAAEGIAAAC